MKFYLSLICSGYITKFRYFLIVGILGLLSNASMFVLLKLYFNVYLSGFFAWFFAATITWWVNSKWTFNVFGGTFMHNTMLWVKYMLSNTIGFAFYYLVFFIFVSQVSICKSYPLLAIFFGAAASFIINFEIARRFVFKQKSAN